MGQIKSIIRLIPILKAYRVSLIAGIAGILLSSLLSTPVPYLIGHLLDKVLMGTKSYKELCLYLSIIALLYVLQFIISLISKNLFVRINNSVVNEIRYTVMKKVMDLPMCYLSNTEKGYVQQRISECSSIGTLFSPMIINTFLGAINAIFALTLMVVINFRVAVIVLILTPIFFLTSRASTKEYRKNTKNMMESSAVLSGESFEILNGIEDIKVLNGKDKQLSKFKSKIDDMVNFSMKQSRSIILLLENINLLNEAGSLIVLAISGILIIKGQFTIGLYTTYSLYIAKVYASTQGLATVSMSLKPAFLSIERTYELLDMKDENNGRDIVLDERVNNIEFRHTGFRYKEDLDVVFEDLNFKLCRGSKVLLQGDNGSGKTTLIKLLLGLYQPTSGQIRLNDINISEINCDSIRQHIGIVSQNIFLFRGTVLDNILYGHKEKDRGYVQDLIISLRLEDYIEKLPKGLDTDISQNTTGISGGQAQIIAFIRAIISERDIIILDEPISNVDVETRRLIINILKNQTFSNILIVISHQTEGLDFFDKIIEIGAK